MNWKTSAALAAVLAAPAFAQEVPGVDGPASGPALGDGPRAIPTLAASGAKRAVAPARRVVLPVLDVKPLLEEDATWASIPALKTDPRVGVTRRFREIHAPRRISPATRGVATMSDGSLVWTAEVSAPAALGLRLHVSRCELPPGATFVVYDADEPNEAYGPFASRGPGDAGAFFLPTVFSETARVEVRVPAKSAGAKLAFSIDRAAQRYRERGEGLDDPRVGAAAKASSCNNNVACDQNYVQDVARAVATMEITTFDGVFLCTGTLLNDSDDATSVPYFLTAHHCLGSEFEAHNTEFYFDYRAATCESSPPPLGSVPRVAGATLLATAASSDFSLLRLTGTLPSNRFFCGWTAVRPASSEPVVGVHHPGGTHMRISYGTLQGVNGNFHEVRWSSGVTAGGSSGSALFNAARQVIGQLYGGSSSCSFRDGIDEYGRFDRTYPSIAEFLGSGSSAPTGDAFDPDDDVAGGATIVLPTLGGMAQGPHSLSSDDAADWFGFDLGAGRRYRFYSSGADDVRATLYSDALGVVAVASDDDSGGSEQFSIDFTAASAGRYRLEVRTAAPAGAAEYTLRAAEVDRSQAGVPLAVARLRRSVRRSVVTLHWKDRARNETGYLVDFSDDDGANWERVAELPRNTRSFVHDAPPGAHLYRVTPWNAAGVASERRVAASVFDPNQLDASDPADDSGAAAVQLLPAAGGTSIVHSLSRADLEDWFRIDLVSGTRYTIQTTSSADTFGELFDDPNGFVRQLSDDDGGPGKNFRIVFTPGRTGAHWLRVAPYDEGDVLSYRVVWSSN